MFRSWGFSASCLLSSRGCIGSRSIHMVRFSYPACLWQTLGWFSRASSYKGCCCGRTCPRLLTWARVNAFPLGMYPEVESSDPGGSCQASSVHQVLHCAEGGCPNLHSYIIQQVKKQRHVRDTVLAQHHPASRWDGPGSCFSPLCLIAASHLKSVYTLSRKTVNNWVGGGQSFPLFLWVSVVSPLK